MNLVPGCVELVLAITGLGCDPGSNLEYVFGGVDDSIAMRVGLRDRRHKEGILPFQRNDRIRETITHMFIDDVLCFMSIPY